MPEGRSPAAAGGGGKKRGKVHKDILVLAAFIEIFCGGNHRDRAKSRVTVGGALGEHLAEFGGELCPDCRRLLLHAAGKRMICPYDPKPRCKKCPTHCYAGDYRERIRRVMRFSGKELLKRGRLDLAFKYFF